MIIFLQQLGRFGLYLLTPEDSRDGAVASRMGIPSGAGAIKTGFWTLVALGLLIALSCLH